MISKILNRTIDEIKLTYKATNSNAVKILVTIYLALLMYLPFHAFFSTWAISIFGNELLLKSWKEIVLLIIALPITVVLLLKNFRQRLLINKINILIIAFATLVILLTIIKNNDYTSEFAGLVIDLRFLIMFMIGQGIAIFITNKVFRILLFKITILAGIFVVIFGAMQVLILPKDFLSNFGYQKDIIQPYFTIDNNEQQVRILSTLRGPNSLGAYLIFWVPFLAIMVQRYYKHSAKVKILLLVLTITTLITLYGSRSRSGMLGVIISLIAVTLLATNKKWRKIFSQLLIAGFVIFSLLLAFSWNSSFIQTNLNHKDPGEASEVNSDNQRLEYISNSIRTIITNPLGAGAGTVNLASTYGENPVTVENYYLHIAQQYGVVGLILFLTILIVVNYELWRLRQYDIAKALLAGSVGLAVANMFLPVWTDETVSMLWWGIAGYVIFSIVNKRQIYDKK